MVRRVFVPRMLLLILAVSASIAAPCGACAPLPPLLLTEAGRPDTSRPTPAPADDGAAWVQAKGPTGGGINTVEIDPIQPDTLYAGGFGGGLYKSADAGATWAPLPRIVPQWMPFVEVIVSPADPQTLYALTVDGEGGGNLYHSVDGGQTWRTVFPGEDFRYSCVALASADPLLLAVGTHDGHVYRSADGGQHWTDASGGLPGDHIADVAIVTADELWAGTNDGVRGRLYHTINGGVSWNQAVFDQPENTAVRSIFVDPDDPALVYVGLRKVPRGEGPLDHSYLWRTRDGGQTWTPLFPPSPPWTVAIMGREPGGAALYVANMSLVHRSTDGGDTWETLPVHPAPSGDVYDLAIDPRDPGVLYLPRITVGILKSTDRGANWTFSDQGILNTGIQIVSAPHVAGSGAMYATGNWDIFKTVDRGESWTHLLQEGMHPVPDELAVSPHDPDTVWYGSDVGQLYITRDGGATWSKLNDPFSVPDPDPPPGGNDDPETPFRFGSVYALAPAPSDPDILYAVKNGFGLFKSSDGGANWQFLPQSEVDYTYSLAVHPTDPDVVYSGYNPKPFQDWAMVRRSTDGGLSWQTVLSAPHSSGITSVAIDPNDPETVYAGSTGQAGGAIFKSSDGGDTWLPLNAHFTTLTVWGQPQLIVHPTHPSVAYAATWLGGTWKTTDAGATWTLLEDAPLSATALSLDAQDPDVIYAADRSAPKLWKSTDGGATWSASGASADWAGSGAFLVNRVLADGDTVYVSTFGPGLHGGKLYKSTDAGTTWADISGELPRSVLDVAVDPTAPGTLYVTTHIYGAYKSSDGGATWTPLAGFPDIGAYDVEVDPVDPNTLYACGLGGISVPDWCMGSGGYTFADKAGVYKSEDAGLTWTQILTTANECRAIRLHPGDPQLLFAAAMDAGLQVSADGGATWTSYNAGLDSRVLTSFAVGADKVYAGTQGLGVYAGDLDPATGAVTWQPDRSNKPVPPVYNLQIAVDPQNSSRLFVSANPGGLFRSDDGGATFYDKNFLTPSVVVDDPFRQGYYPLAINPENPSEVWIGTWGKGLYKSYDAMDFDVGAHGTDRVMFGKHVNQIVITPEAVYAATDEGVFRSDDGGASWTDWSAGLDTPQVRTLAVRANGRLLAGALGYELYRRDPSAAAWEQLNVLGGLGVTSPIWDRPFYQLTTIGFHPTDPDVVYAGTFPAGMFKTVDGGQTWREINTGFRNDGVFSLAFHPDDPDILYAGTYNGVSRSTDAGAHWEVLDQGWPAEQWVFSIAFDPRNPEVMYACSKNGENKGNGREGFHGAVMKSLDGGVSWFPITATLNVNQEFYKVIVDPHNPDTLYLATQGEGVWISHDGGAAWSPWNEGLTHLLIGNTLIANPLTLSTDGSYLYLGTDGAGVFWRMIAAPARPVHLPLVLKHR